MPSYQRPQADVVDVVPGEPRASGGLYGAQYRINVKRPCIAHGLISESAKRITKESPMTTPVPAKTREEWETILLGINSDMSDAPARYLAKAIDAIMSLQASETKLSAENRELYQSLCSTNTQYGQLEEAEKELRAEVERLGRTKREWDTLISPLLDFGRDNAEHLDLRVGDCIITKALGLMEEKVKKGGR